MLALLSCNLLLHIQVSRMKHKKHIHKFDNLFALFTRSSQISLTSQCWSELNIGDYELLLNDLILET